MRTVTAGSLDVNLFVPQPSVADLAPLECYAEEFRGGRRALPGRSRSAPCRLQRPLRAQARGGGRHTPRVGVVHFRCAVPGCHPAVGRPGTVGDGRGDVRTYEARVAVAAGADSLVVQNPGAGGHFGTLAPDMEPITELFDPNRQRKRCTAHRNRQSGRCRRRRCRTAQGSDGPAGQYRTAELRSWYQCRAKASAVRSHRREARVLR